MIKILAYVLLPLSAFAFSLSISNGASSGNEYNIIRLEDSLKIECARQTMREGSTRYVCMALAADLELPQDISLPLVDIAYKKEDDKLFVVILPKTASKMYETSPNLYEKTSIIPNPALKADERRSGYSFEVLLSQDISPFDNDGGGGLNFGVNFSSLLRPSVGALDLSKAPLESFDSNDIDAYLSVKKAFDAKKWEQVINDANTALSRHPNSLFSAEFALLKMQAIDALLTQQADTKEQNNPEIGYDAIIKQGKAWLFANPSDEAYSQVLALITKAYIKEGHLSDAGYTLDVLLAEHSDSLYTQIAQLDYADALYATGKAKDATQIYEQVLYGTKDLNIASRAALALANTNIQKDKFDLAKEFVLKVLNANSDIFLKSPSKAGAMAKAFEEKNMYDVSASIYGIIASSQTLNRSEQELWLKNWGVALLKAGKSDEALAVLERYKKEYPYGEFIEEVQAGIDKLFFDTTDKDASARLAYYDELIKRYGDGEIAKKAVIEKLALSIELRRYEEALAMTDVVKEMFFSQEASSPQATRARELLDSAALQEAIKSIKNGQCQRVVWLVENYDFDRLELPQFKLYDCFVRSSRYEEALGLARSHADDSSLIDRVEWLSLIAKSELKLGDANTALKASSDAIALASRIEYADISSALFTRLYALLSLKDIAKAIQTMDAIEQLKGYPAPLLQSYDALASAALSQKDSATASTYASKGLALARRLGVDSFWPDLNFIYIEALINLGHLNDALLEVKSLLATPLAPLARARALSTLAGVLLELNQTPQAVAILQECASSNFESEFKAMCQNRLNLLQTAK